MLIAIKGNKSDRQVAQVERACKSIVSHLYDVPPKTNSVD